MLTISVELESILDKYGFQDATYSLRDVEGYIKEKHLFAYNCAELVLPLFNRTYVGYTTLCETMKIINKFIKGEIGLEELDVAHGRSKLVYTCVKAQENLGLIAYAISYAASGITWNKDAPASHSGVAAFNVADAAYIVSKDFPDIREKLYQEFYMLCHDPEAYCK